MPLEPGTDSDDTTRLLAIQIRVRQLARERPEFAAELRLGYKRFEKLAADYSDAKRKRDERLRGLVYALLSRGRIDDPKVRPGMDGVCFRQYVLLKVDEAEQLEAATRGQRLTLAQRTRLARSLQKALASAHAYQSAQLSAAQRSKASAQTRRLLNAGTHCETRCEILVQRPPDWHEPLNPWGLHPEFLEEFNDQDFRTIALYRLGGLADAGALRHIVPKPKQSGDPVRDTAASALWSARFPGNLPECRDSTTMRLYPDIAQLMLDEVTPTRTPVSPEAPQPSGAPRTSPTRRDLMAAAGVSAQTFLRVRRAATVSTPYGKEARTRRYTPDEVQRMIDAVVGGSFQRPHEIARAWAEFIAK